LEWLLPTSFFSNFLFHNEPAWRDGAAVFGSSLPMTLRPWLLDQGSLTQRLIVASGDRFSVQVIKQRWELPRLSERLALRIPSNHLALVREVILLGADTPWVYARSILPMSSLTGRLRKLRNLDNRPLGALLFSDKTMQRSNLEVACLTSDNISTAKQLGPFEQPIWGRRSVFRLDNKPLLVSEIFLPSFPAYNNYPANK
jgi:chorismate--pyruvate lyase